MNDCQTSHRSMVGPGRFIQLALILIFAFALASDAEAQRRRRKIPSAKPNATPAEKAAAAEEKKNEEKATTTQEKPAPKPGEKIAAEPENVLLEVKDEGVFLVATWYAAPVAEIPEKDEEGNPIESGKVTAPFILLHDWDGNRQQMLLLAKSLQDMGHAVIVPDLRGHGESLNVRGGNRQLDYTKFKKGDVATVVGDIEQCKRFLREKNDLGELNIDMLNVVAVGDTCHLAIEWAISDWSWGPVGNRKQGQDVKSLVLVAPSEKFMSSSMKKLAKAPLISGTSGSALPTMMIWGTASSDNRICKEVYSQLEKNRPASNSNDPEVFWAQQDLFKVTPATGLTGAQIVQSPDAKTVFDYIGNFVAQKVVAHAEQCPWQVRGKKKKK